jgi:hypothetical protein
MPSQVFLSYSSKDIEIAESLDAELQDQGIPVWRDKERLGVGHPWSDEVRKAVEDSACVILICTPSSMNSNPVDMEWRSALGQSKQILPLMFETCTLPNELKELHYLDYQASKSSSEFLDKLISELATFRFSLPTPELECSDPFLRWTDVSGADKYIVEKSNDTRFEDVTSRTRTMHIEDIGVDILSEEIFYYRVQAVSKNAAVSNSDWSNTIEVGGNQSLKNMRKLMDEIEAKK